jgi:hypothetical protein
MKNVKTEITAEHVRSLLKYDADSGVFTWRVRPCYSMRAGDIAGSPDPINRYVRIKIGGELYLAHRLAWLYVYGEWPQNEIDHKDRNRENNRLSNLRTATPQENRCNKKIYANNLTGAKGVYWHKQHGKYAAAIQANGNRKHLGLFDSIYKASQAYNAAAVALHGNFIGQTTV